MHSIELKDTYFHMPVHHKSGRFLAVSFKGQIYQFKALPLGHNLVFWLFTMIAREFASLIHIQNTALHQFLDD